MLQVVFTENGESHQEIFKRSSQATLPANTTVYRMVEPSRPRMQLPTLTITDKIRDDDGLSKLRVVFELPSNATNEKGVPLASIKCDSTFFLPYQVQQFERSRFETLRKYFDNIVSRMVLTMDATAIDEFEVDQITP